MFDSSAYRRWACSNLAVLSFKESGTKRCVEQCEDQIQTCQKKLPKMTQDECVQLYHFLQIYHLGYHGGHQASSIREPQVESATSITVQHYTAVGVVGRCGCASLASVRRWGSVAAVVILCANNVAVVLLRQTVLEAAKVLWRRECWRLRESVALMKGMLRSFAHVRAGRSHVSVLVQLGCGYGEADFDISQLLLAAAACLIAVAYNARFYACMRPLQWAGLQGTGAC